MRSRHKAAILLLVGGASLGWMSSSAGAFPLCSSSDSRTLCALSVPSTTTVHIHGNGRDYAFYVRKLTKVTVKLTDITRVGRENPDVAMDFDDLDNHFTKFTMQTVTRHNLTMTGEFHRGTYAIAINDLSGARSTGSLTVGASRRLRWPKDDPDCVVPTAQNGESVAAYKSALRLHHCTPARTLTSSRHESGHPKGSVLGPYDQTEGAHEIFGHLVDIVVNR